MTYPHHPRFGSNYRGLTNRLDLLLECYSYLTFAERVRTTYATHARDADATSPRTRDDVIQVVAASARAARSDRGALQARRVRPSRSRSRRARRARSTARRRRSRVALLRELRRHRPWSSGRRRTSCRASVAAHLARHGLARRAGAPAQHDVEVATVTGFATEGGRKILEASEVGDLAGRRGSARRARCRRARGSCAPISRSARSRSTCASPRATTARSRTASSPRPPSATSSRSGAPGRSARGQLHRMQPPGWSAREADGAAEPDREQPAEIGARDDGDDRIAAGGRVLGAEHDRLAVARHLDRAEHHRPRDLGQRRCAAAPDRRAGCRRGRCSAGSGTPPTIRSSSAAGREVRRGRDRGSAGSRPARRGAVRAAAGAEPSRRARRWRSAGRCGPARRARRTAARRGRRARAARRCRRGSARYATRRGSLATASSSPAASVARRQWYRSATSSARSARITSWPSTSIAGASSGVLRPRGWRRSAGPATSAPPGGTASCMRPGRPRSWTVTRPDRADDDEAHGTNRTRSPSWSSGPSGPNIRHADDRADQVPAARRVERIHRGVQRRRSRASRRAPGCAASCGAAARARPAGRSR